MCNVLSSVTPDAKRVVLVERTASPASGGYRAVGNRLGARAVRGAGGRGGLSGGGAAAGAGVDTDTARPRRTGPTTADEDEPTTHVPELCIR